MVSDFFNSIIFLRPLWLLATPVLLLWLWYLSKRAQSAGWSRYLSSEKIAVLRIPSATRIYYRYFVVPVLVGCIAMAGPALTSNPADIAGSEHARVLVFDLSPSMLARDIKPDRLTQARYKTIDLLRQHIDGEIALVVYANTAFRVTPLTDDPATIEALVPTLHPDIMPDTGSNTELALATAFEMLQTSGTGSGDVLLITDGVTAAAAQRLERLLPVPYPLSILGIGTPAGAAIPLESGVLADELQQPVIASLNEGTLRTLANQFNGRYASWTADSADVEHLSVRPDSTARIVVSSDSIGRVSPEAGVTEAGTTEERSQQEFDRYRDLGYWLLPVLMAFAVLAFRKNVIYAVIPLLLVIPPASPTEATPIEPGHWWLNKNQRALSHLHHGNPDEAYHQFTRADWKAVAAYQRGDYAEAARLLATPVYAEDLYNRGNAQAMNGELQAALKSFAQALLLYSEDELVKRADTQHNIKVIKTLIDQNNTDNSDDEGAGNSQSNDNTRTRINGDTEAADQTIEDNAPANIGGSTGPGQTLDQQSLSENTGQNSTAQAEPVQSAELPDDASQRQNPDATPQNAQTKNTETDAEIDLPTGFEENNSVVLSPYSEQFLRDLPQDPGGYLRRKFLYLHQTNTPAPGSLPTEIRY